MKYQTLLKSTSPRLAALEAKLGKEGQKPGRAARRVLLRCHDGVKRGVWVSLSDEEFENWFWKMISQNKVSGCWNWIGLLSGTGYGRFRKDRRHWSAHRFVSKILTGEDTDLEVCHTCDNPKCCNPSHLFLGTHGDNMRDCVSKGRLNAAAGENHTRSKLTWSDVLKIRKAKGTIREIGKRFGIFHTHIGAIRRGEKWKVRAR